MTVSSSLCVFVCVLHSVPRVLWWKRPASQSSCICPKAYPYHSSQINDTNCSCPDYFPLCSWTLLHENRSLVTGQMELLLPLQSVKLTWRLHWLIFQMMLYPVLGPIIHPISSLRLTSLCSKTGHCSPLVWGIPRFSVPTWYTAGQHSWFKELRDILQDLL